MTFATKIQSLKGTHVPSGTTNGQCGVDWGRRRVFIGNGTYLSRVGIRTGTEQTYALASGYAEGGFPPIGLDSDGNLYQSIAASLYSGGIQGISGDTLAKTIRATYTAPNYGGSNTVAVKTGSQQFAISTNIGNTIINLNNTSVSKGKNALVSVGWPNGNARSAICAGKPGSNLAFLLTSPGDGISTQISTLHKIVCGITATVSVVDTYVPHDIDSNWTESYIAGACVDETDGDLLVSFFGVGGSQGTYIVKLDHQTGAIVWKCAVDSASGGSGAVGQNQMSQSRIRNQRLVIATNSSGNKITIIDTSDGSKTSYTTGLNGLTIYNYQCYDDTLGAIIGVFSMVPASGGPTLLRNTPATYAGWFVLYVADAITPSTPDIVPGFDEVEAYEPPIIIPPVRQLDLFRSRRSRFIAVGPMACRYFRFPSASSSRPICAWKWMASNSPRPISPIPAEIVRSPAMRLAMSRWTRQPAIASSASGVIARHPGQMTSRTGNSTRPRRIQIWKRFG
jgi:hypothetical protein